MADAKTKARKRFARVARRLEGLFSALLAEERSLEAAGDFGQDKESEHLAAAAGCAAVDHLRPAIESLQKAAHPSFGKGDPEEPES